MLEIEFDTYPLWAELTRGSEIFAAIDESGDLESMRGIDPFRGLMSATSARRDADPNLVSNSMMSGLYESWDQINRYLEAFRNSGAHDFLDRANFQADQLRTQLSTFPQNIEGGNAQANLTRLFKQYRGELDKSRERLSDRLREVIDESAKREADLSASIDRLHGSLESASDMVAALEERVVHGEIRMDASLNANNETFIVGQSARDKEFRSWLGDREKSFERLAAPHLESIKVAGSDALENLAVIADLRTSTVEMSSLAAGDILADKYGEYAKSERITSYIAYGVGVVASLGSIAIILFAFGTLQDPLDWQHVALKFGLSAAAGGVAAVAFRFGGQAVRRTTSFKRQELELRALQPFLMDVEGADLAKTAFLERAFGRAWEEPAHRRGDTDVNDSMVKLMSSLIQNMPKS